MIRLLSPAALGLLVALPAAANEFRWASTTDPQTMDPHAVNSAPVLGFLNNVYEGLVRRGKDHRTRARHLLAADRRRRGLALHPARGRDLPRRLRLHRRGRPLLL